MLRATNNAKEISKRKAICVLNGGEESRECSYGCAYQAPKAFGLIGEIWNRFDAH